MAKKKDKKPKNAETEQSSEELAQDIALASEEATEELAASEDDEVIDLSESGDEEALQAQAEASTADFSDNEIAEGESEEDEGLLAELAGESEDALDEFKDYDSLDDEYPEDELDAAEGDADATGILTPKERRLQSMTLEARVESVLFASQKPLKSVEIIEILADDTLTVEHIDDTLKNIMDFYETRSGGFRLHYLKRLGYQFQTSDNAGAIMEKMFASRPRPISRAALETLAIIAYRQPVTRAEVEFIRGVDAGSIFKTLLERDLIKCTGRKEIVGRPMLFGTSDDFLKVFNLSSIKDLPPLEAFQPSREVVQGAMERINEGDEDLVDIEQYIAANTDGGDVESSSAEGDEAAEGNDEAAFEAGEGDAQEEGLDAGAEGDDSIEASAETQEEGAADSDDDLDLLESVADQLNAGKERASRVGASKEAAAADVMSEKESDDQELSSSEDSDGTNSDTKVALSDGDSIPERSGDLD